jgi:hypothetical protein
LPVIAIVYAQKVTVRGSGCDRQKKSACVQEMAVTDETFEKFCHLCLLQPPVLAILLLTMKNLNFFHFQNKQLN